MVKCGLLEYTFFFRRSLKISFFYTLLHHIGCDCDLCKYMLAIVFLLNMQKVHASVYNGDQLFHARSAVVEVRRSMDGPQTVE